MLTVTSYLAVRRVRTLVRLAAVDHHRRPSPAPSSLRTLQTAIFVVIGIVDPSIDPFSQCASGVDYEATTALARRRPPAEPMSHSITPQHRSDHGPT
jgi:hypothetical protein